jgi:predicted nucleotidyltransferase
MRRERWHMDDQAIIDVVLDLLRAEFGADLEGVLVGGSRVRGEAGPNSDLDVVVVVAPP